MSGPSIPELEARLAATSVAPIDPIARVDALTELAWALRLSEVRRCHALASEARDLAITHGYKLGQARAARAMAMAPAGTAELRMMFGLAEEARRLFDEVDDGPGRAASRDFLASLHEYTGDLAGGMELALDALSIAREIGDPVRQGHALSNIGGILAATGEVDAAVERLREALAIFREAQEHSGIVTITSRLAKVLKDAGRFDEALSFAEQCAAAAATLNDGFSRWGALRTRAEVEHARGDAAAAERFYRAALECVHTEPPGVAVLGAETKIALAGLLMARGALGEAEDALSEVLARVADDPMLIVGETTAREALAELFERQGKLAEAIEQLRKAHALRGQIAQQDARNKRAQIEGRAAVEAARKDAEIHKLRFVELHGMQAKLVEAEKMAALGRFAAGAAHELNTPLAVLRSNTQLAATAAARLEGLLPDEGATALQAQKLVAVLEACRQTNEDAVARIAAVTQSLTRFTALDQAVRRAFDLRAGIESALAVLGPTIPEAIAVERRFEEIPRIEGWPRELNHAFMTVLQNAVQAIDGAGVITVEARATAEHVLVRVRDTGRGMSAAQVAHLFDVSWSADGERATMRLGLAAAYATVQQHGGTMEVESTLGGGTVVAFRFPVPGAPRGATSSRGTPGSPR